MFIPASHRGNSCTQLECVYVLFSESGWYWILCVCWRVCVYACMLLSMCICVPYMPPWMGFTAAPCLRRWTLNTRLVKLSHGVAWPCSPHRSLIFVTTTMEIKHCLILLLFQCIIFKAFCSNTSSLMHGYITGFPWAHWWSALSWGASLFSSPKTEEPSPHSCDTLPWTVVCRPAGYLPNSIYQITVQINVQEKLDKSATTGNIKRNMVAIINHSSVSGRGCRRIRAERHSAKSSLAEDRLSDWRCETWMASLLSTLQIL